MPDEFDFMVADRCHAVVDVPVPSDLWSRVQLKVLDDIPVQLSDEATMVDLEAPSDTDEHRTISKRVPVVALLAAALLLGVAGMVLVQRDSRKAVVVTTNTRPETTTVEGESSFAAAIDAAGVLIQPSAEEIALASNTRNFQPISGPTQITAGDSFVSLHTCRPAVDYPSTCSPTDWAYTTGSVDGGETHRGLLGNANQPELYVLDDRFVVAMETSPGSQLGPRAWLIDSVSGGHAELTWRDEPTTISSREQGLVIFDDPSPVTNLWAEVPIQRFLPRVVDARDGTIRPLAVPDNASANLPVAQNGKGRIWIGTAPDGHDLGEEEVGAVQMAGFAYSDDGGATWTEVTLPAQILASERLTPKASGASIAADGDHIAVTAAWLNFHDRHVYVSDDAGLSWSTVTVASSGGNGALLYVLADKRLLLVRSNDAYANQLLVSTGSDWTQLEEDSQATRATTGKSFSVNRAGTFTALETDSSYGHPSRIVFSTDLTNWRTIAVPDD